MLESKVELIPDKTNPTFMPPLRRPYIMANGNAPPPPQPPGGSMLMMLGVMVMMTLLIMNPSIRGTLGSVADPILSPILPEESYFVFTVLILGTFSMTMNTVLRNLFTDPMAQAHIGHRQRQVRQMMNDARMSRDPILQEKATTLQQQMMPEQLKVQMCYEADDVHHGVHYRHLCMAYQHSGKLPSRLCVPPVAYRMEPLG